MTHDDLLVVITNAIDDNDYDYPCQVLEHTPMLKALREIAILHQPQSIELLSGETISTYCLECDDFDYPCSTIYIIEKVLK